MKIANKKRGTGGYCDEKRNPHFAAFGVNWELRFICASIVAKFELASFFVILSLKIFLAEMSFEM